MSAQPLRISVVICAYTEKRWDDLVASIASIEGQSAKPDEVIVVIDHNPRLFERARQAFPAVRVIESAEEQGLSGARNTGIAAATGDILAFIDEDASAAPDWLACLLTAYTDDSVMGVGGAIHPQWLSGRPRWFPSEFDWVVGCTYTGMPVSTAPVRNMIGCNMSFRREVFQAVGGFRTGIGRIGALPFGCEETELCIRARQRWPARRFVYEPAAGVQHRVPAIRARFAYFRSRCYAEGLSKAAISRFIGTADGLSSEQTYTFRTLPAGVWRGLRDFLRGDWPGLGRAAAIVLGLGFTTLGYLVGLVKARSAPRPDLGPAQPAPRLRAGEETSAPAPGRLRVLMVTPRYAPFIGGVENHVQQVSSRMVRQGAEVTVLTTDPTGKLPRSERLDGVEVLRVRAWPSKSDLYFAPGIYGVIRRGRWDIIHVQSYHTFVPPLAMLAARRAKIPYVLTFHGGGHTSRLRNSIRSLQRAMLRPLLRHARRLVAVAGFEIREYGRELRLPRERFALIPNGADFPELARSPATSSRNGTLVVSVGRLEQYKGHQRVIAALPHLLAARPDARLRIAGSGPYEAKLRRQAEELGVAERVEIGPIPPGERSRMAELLSNASVTALLSDFETHPISVLEALACGSPVLVADNSGMRELAERGWARAIPADSPPEETARAMLQQIEAPLLPQEMDLPSWDDCAEALLNLYGEVLTGS